MLFRNDAIAMVKNLIIFISSTKASHCKTTENRKFVFRNALHNENTKIPITSITKTKVEGYEGKADFQAFPSSVFSLYTPICCIFNGL
jgi:hypothetical protein